MLHKKTNINYYKVFFGLLTAFIFIIQLYSCEKLEEYNYVEYMNYKTTDLVDSAKAV